MAQERKEKLAKGLEVLAMVLMCVACVSALIWGVVVLFEPIKIDTILHVSYTLPPFIVAQCCLHFARVLKTPKNP
ncbi:hypothetical protein NHP190012_14100 [Helicobacter sp. NHP19-012]|uniref:Uncharacterized protein n=1 Tax=Helicobacter gastrofelis TaxID=2849642 RepID=A0ABM7SJC6_9HELI|nr:MULTISPECIES: hypothetical protein [unclassified Helicobacter]BCZ19768.1 hypothetical protein NHP190012_14100 [Helicobacter sp. NHP19-012]GMB95448.1 hypothetical protein NHP22001_00370 [Helicobacter sp. NHP22-001]